MKLVVLYSSNQCPRCDKATLFLDRHGISYRLCNVKTPEGQKELAKAGFRTLPVMKEADQYIVGFNENQFKKHY